MTPPPSTAPASRIEISPMAPREGAAVAALVAEVIGSLSYYNERARAAEIAKYTPEGLERCVADDPLSVLVARDGEHLVGFCISRCDDGLLWLSWFATRLEYRGRGIGARLLRALAATAGARHAHKIWCDSRTDNLRSRMVLERAGFRRVAELTNHWYGQDFFLWEWYPG